jgi:hypothetical protein
MKNPRFQSVVEDLRGFKGKAPVPIEDEEDNILRNQLKEVDES